MKITALAGGVGGAKLAHGLAQILPPEDLTIIVNTDDDFEDLGLYISPALDWAFTCIGLPIFVADLFAWGGPELVNAVFGRRADHIYK